MATNKTYLEEKLRTISSELSKIESEYIELEDIVDLKLAYSLGYIDKSNNIDFVFKRNSFTAFLLDINEL